MLHAEVKAFQNFWSIFVDCINIINIFKNKIAIKSPYPSFPLHTFNIIEELVSLFKGNSEF